MPILCQARSCETYHRPNLGILMARDRYPKKRNQQDWPDCWCTWIYSRWFHWFGVRFAASEFQFSQLNHNHWNTSTSGFVWKLEIPKYHDWSLIVIVIDVPLTLQLCGRLPFPDTQTHPWICRNKKNTGTTLFWCSLHPNEELHIVASEYPITSHDITIVSEIPIISVITP